MTRMSYIGLALMVPFLVAACGQQASEEPSETYEFRVAHVMAPSYSVSRGYEQLAQISSEKSDGRIQMEIFDGGALCSSDAECVEAMTGGTADMASISNQNLASFDPKVSVTNLPHLFNSPEDWTTLWESEVGDELRESLESNGLKPLMFSEYGFRETAVTANNPVRTPSDLQGLGLRATDSPLEIAAFEYYGANAVPIGWAEVYTALQQGTVDGQVNALPLMTSAQHQEVLGAVTLNKLAYTNMILVMDTEQYESLPNDIKEILAESISEAEEADRQFQEESEREAEQTFEEAGVETYTPSAEEMNEWQEVSQEFWANEMSGENRDLLERAYEIIYGEEL